MVAHENPGIKRVVERTGGGELVRSRLDQWLGEGH